MKKAVLAFVDGIFRQSMTGKWDNAEKGKMR